MNSTDKNIGLDPEAFAKELLKLSDCFAGVPDSLMNDLCSAMERILPAGSFWTTANEGAAVAVAAGYTLATGKPGIVYMQNSGLGNCINPLLSLNDPMVYGIPALLLIGWRGEPQTRDEPQHKKQGIVTGDILDACKIPYRVLPDDMDLAVDALEWAKKSMAETLGAVALLIRKGTFHPLAVRRNNGYFMGREDAIGEIIKCLSGRNCVIVSTTGMISRELYELRAKRNESHDCDFLTVGAMGHASQIALGIAAEKPGKTVVCLDGDGAALMHMGALAIIGSSSVNNYLHVVLNNGAHDSVGGLPTCASSISLSGVANSCGYTSSSVADNIEKLRDAVEAALKNPGRNFIEAKVALGARKDLGRPDVAPSKCKEDFMSAVSKQS